MKNILILSTIALCIAGCSLFQPVTEVTIEHKERLIHNAAQSSVYLAIKMVYPDDVIRQNDKAYFLVAEIEESVLPILQDPNLTLDQVTIDLLLIKILSTPGIDNIQWSMLMQNAVDIFGLYFRTPSVGEIVSGDNSRLLLALFEGVRDGANLILLGNGEITEL